MYFVDRIKEWNNSINVHALVSHATVVLGVKSEYLLFLQIKISGYDCFFALHLHTGVNVNTQKCCF